MAPAPGSAVGTSFRRPSRGSAIITVLVLAAVTAVIASSFMFRSAQEARLAGRSLMLSAALNLAEAGIEEGLFAANSTAAFTTANGWTLVSGSTADYQKTITSGFNFQQATGSVYVRVDNTDTLTPVVIAAGKITIPNQPPIVKQIRVGGTKRRLWTNGMISRGTLTFSGSTVIDSYDSSVGPYHSATNRTDQVTVASASTAVDPVVVGSNASIYGYVATTGAEPVVGPGGRIYGATTPEGTSVDASRLRYDFTSNFPDVTPPTSFSTGVLPTTLGNVTSSVTLPRIGDVPTASGRYVYRVTSVNLTGTDAISIKGPVDIVVTGGFSISGTATLSVGGTDSVDPSINLYCAGAVELGGNGMANQTANPAKATIWGTAASPSTQSINVSGNGSYTGTIYAPNGTVTLSGSGDTSGAVIGGTITVSGSGRFHYDTDLGSVEASLDTSYRLSSWSELTGTPGGGSAFARDNRAPFASLF
jgi:hypothetical protein